MAKKTEKTNAARLLDQAGVEYELIPYVVDENNLAACNCSDKRKCSFHTVLLSHHMEHYKRDVCRVLFQGRMAETQHEKDRHEPV